MASDSYTLFCEQLRSVVNKYPNFKIIEHNGKKALKGILDIRNDQNEVIGSFLIQIIHSIEFPFRFPLLFEVGGAIPNIADRHINSDGSCCITVLPDEILKCYGGISVLSYIENYAIPYLANQIYFKEEGHYLNGEYSHWYEGYVEFYTQFFKTADITRWRRDVNQVKSGNIITMDRNKPCFCGSGIKYKKCHDKIYYDITRLGTDILLKQFDEITLIKTY